MPALLVVDTSTRPASSSNASTASDHSRKRADSGSLDRPPVSPITPTATHAQLAPIERSDARPRVAAPPPPPPAATFIKQPPSAAISESDNPDAIALRSAISLLQLQREKSKRDLKALEDLKAAAVADPRAFARSLQEQRAQPTRAHQDVLTPTLSDLADFAPSHEPAQQSVDARKDSVNLDTNSVSAKFPAIPQPQNVVRCPPVNWAKYHVVGEPLDKMHEEQRKWPGSAEPPKLQSGMRAPPHSIAAPYSPFTDGVGRPASTPQPPKGYKKSPSRS